jgi:hypothetical protein
MRTPKSYFLYIQREQSIMYSLQKRILLFLTIFTCPQFVYIYIYNARNRDSKSFSESLSYEY